ncbi:hypothetical protein CDAR_613101 [Caerostris darwini]|uniref:Uncharacterized protein n=1 Tax=Caerostris darwini TaxID=1538125 RepID=A0AAV4UL22_9ARAC|nr:hypothetical protein CDAR_613101 [Caerostris darwini]
MLGYLNRHLIFRGVTFLEIMYGFQHVWKGVLEGCPLTISRRGVTRKPGGEEYRMTQTHWLNCDTRLSYSNTEKGKYLGKRSLQCDQFDFLQNEETPSPKGLRLAAPLRGRSTQGSSPVERQDSRS